MIAYILDKKDCKIKDYFYFKDYLFCDDIEYSDKSKITIPKKANVEDDDFVYCKDDNNKPIFFGIAYDTATNDRTDNVYLTLKPKECLFDRFIFTGNEALIATSIESYVVSCITDNWVSSNDSLMDRAYITPTALTNTAVVASLSNITNVENGIFNLKTFLGNIKERYGIYLDFVLTDTNPAILTGPVLTIKVYKDSNGVIPIDTDVSDISDVEEVYNVDVLAKLKVKWLNTSNNTTTYRTFYLKADRSVTETVGDVNRVDGVTRAIYIEADSESEMLSQVTNEFQQNSYEHKISFNLRNNSLLYKPSDYYVGRKVQIETKLGVKTSLITAIEEETTSGVRKVTMGKLKVTLTAKLRDRK